MRLHLFIEDHMAEIMAEWVAFARTLDSDAEEMTLVQLRDHAEAMLRSIASDIGSRQTGQEQYDKSRGNAQDEGALTSPASIHGTQRHKSNFTLLQLSAEFRALRATVLRLWLPTVSALAPETIQEMIRFNESIDQALAESVMTYSKRSDQSREMFLAILGHDLRAPLSTVALSAQLLSKPGLAPAEVIKTAGRVRRSARLMSAMVDDLIGYTRTELGSGMPVVLKPSDVGEVCRAAIEDAHSAFPETQFTPSFEGEMKGSFDGVRLHQLFTNLLVNAAKYGDPGEPVRVRAVGEGESVRIEVNNRGPVIPRDSWETVFRPLVQLTDGNSDDPRNQRTSLGLGLYVAREIATLHGGQIEIDSSQEAGTTFSVSLPRAKQPPAA